MNIESLHIPLIDIRATHLGYTVQAEHPKTGDAVSASYATMNAALARSIELLQAGYSLEIWSPASLEEH